MLHLETVSSDLIRVLRQLMLLPELKDFRLVGGTSLALQLGHRTSVDIDMFTNVSFDPVILHKEFVTLFESFELNWENRNGFTSTIDNIKVDLFNWNVPFTKPPIIESGLILLDELEIGAMKCEAITTRKEKKDYIDIAFLLKKYSMKQLLMEFKNKYPFMNIKFVLESLMAVDYADQTAEPTMLNSFSWNETKEFIISSVGLYFETNKKEIELKQTVRIKKAEDLIKNRKKD